MSTATQPMIDPTKEWDEWPDMLGQKLVAGDWVVYGSSHGHLILGTIESIDKVDQWGNEVTAPGDMCLFDLYMQTKDWNDYKAYQKSIEDGVTTPWASVTVVPRKYDASMAKNGNRRRLKYMGGLLRQNPPV